MGRINFIKVLCSTLVLVVCVFCFNSAFATPLRFSVSGNFFSYEENNGSFSGEMWISSDFALSNYDGAGNPLRGEAEIYSYQFQTNYLGVTHSITGQGTVVFGSHDTYWHFGDTVFSECDFGGMMLQAAPYNFPTGPYLPTPQWNESYGSWFPGIASADDPIGAAHFNLEYAPVPEPATMLLFGIGIAGIAGSRLKKRRNDKE